MRYNKNFIYLLCISLFTACVPDEPTNNNSFVNTSGEGVIITNEGNFMLGNASLSYYNPKDSSSTKDIYQIKTEKISSSDVKILQVALVSENEKYTVEVVGDQNWTLDGQAKFNGRFFLVKDQKDMLVNQEDVTLLLMQNGEVIDKISTSFVGPVFSNQ